MTEIWLIRHGQTDWNKLRLYQGQTDIPLNETGFEQARQTAETLARSGCSFTAVYTSDLVRARQTAQVIADRLALPLLLEKGLREICLGDWEGAPYAEKVEHYHQLVQSGQDAPNFRAPGAESVAEVAARVKRAVDALAERHPEERIIAVLHGVAMSSLLCSIHDIPLTDVYRHFPKNVLPTVIEWPVQR